MKSKKTLLVLDLDGTITKTDNLVQFTMFMIKKQKQLRFLLFYPLVFLLKLKLISNIKFKRLYASYILKGMRNQTLILNVEEFINSTIFSANINNKVAEFISEYSESDKIILSANFSFLVKPISKILNISDQVSINLKLQNGIHTGEIKGIIPYGQAKIDVIKPYLSEGNYSMTIGLGNSVSDVPLLRFVDEGYLVKYDDKTKLTSITII